MLFNRLRYFVVLVMALAIAALFGACGSSSSSSTAADDDATPADDDATPTDDDDDDNDDASPADDDDDASPQVAWAIQTVLPSGYVCKDGATSTVRCHALAFTAAGDPVIAWYDGANGGGLKVATQTGPNSAWSIDAIETTTNTGRDPSVAVDATGRIGIAYFNVETTSVMFASLIPGGNWTTETVADVHGIFGAGGWPTLHFHSPDNLAHIAAVDGFSGDVYYFIEGAAGAWTQTTLFKQVGGTKGPDFDFDSHGLPGLAWQNSGQSVVLDTYFGTYDLNQTAKDELVNATGVPSYELYFGTTYDAADAPPVFYNYSAVGDPMQVAMAVNAGTGWQKSFVPDNSQQLEGPLEAHHHTDAVWVSYACDYPETPRLAKLENENWTLYDVLDNNQSQFGKHPAFNLDADGLPGVVYTYLDLNGVQSLNYAKMTVK
jgi:hypothetical protein